MRSAALLHNMTKFQYPSAAAHSASLAVHQNHPEGVYEAVNRQDLDHRKYYKYNNVSHESNNILSHTSSQENVRGTFFLNRNFIPALLSLSSHEKQIEKEGKKNESNKKNHSCNGGGGDDSFSSCLWQYRQLQL